jgi:glutamine amidotransferase/cyclase
VPHQVIETRILGPAGERYCWYQCTVKGGREGRDLDAVTLAQVCEKLGAGEILLNCIDRDGTKSGFDIELINAVKNAVSIPVIASSGAGCVEHFLEVFEKTEAESALAAGIFHRHEVPLQDVKNFLKDKVEIRPTL